MTAAGQTHDFSIPTGVPLLLRDLLHERTGIFFEADRLALLLDKLADRVQARSLGSYLDYYYLLKYDGDAEPEWRRVMDALSVQETYFWREMDQIEALTSVLVPAWRRSSGAPLRIWSAACATGEEPYTIAMAMAEAGHGDLPVEIVASDASEAALERAREGLYRERSFRSLPERLRTTYFHREPGGWRVDEAIAHRVRFTRANLVNGDDVHPLATSDVVFCRNVFIYFSPEAIRRAVTALAGGMPAGGHLFIGASESLIRLTTDFELTEIGDAFAYVRNRRIR